MDVNGKLWAHGCGYMLWAVVRGKVGDAVVVEYRDGDDVRRDVPLYHCPGCAKPLQLWWRLSAGDTRFSALAGEDEGD